MTSTGSVGSVGDTQYMGGTEPSGVTVWSPKIANQSLVRKFVSQNGNGYVAISIQDNTSGPQAMPVDPDPGSLVLTVWFADVLTNPPAPGTNPFGNVILTADGDSIQRIEKGKYFFDIGPQYTKDRGLLTCVWTYTVGDVPFQFTDSMQILNPMPLYDSLTPRERNVVEMVSWMFADLFDSTEGGPNLMEKFQTHWDFERISQMQAISVQRMNFIGNFGNIPTSWAIGNLKTGYTVPSQNITKTITLPNGEVDTVTYPTKTSYEGGGGVPPQYHGLVVLGTYIECMRHFRDTYTEIPMRPGIDVAWADRTSYQQRWAANLQTENEQWRQDVRRAKIALLGLSHGSLLVAGGIYGGSALGIFQAGTYAAMVRAWRFYPAAPAIMWGATSH